MKIFDAYRPLSVQQKLYDSTPCHLKEFVAKPSSNAKHSKGIAVDCTLIDIDGIEISMPSEFDEFNSSSYINYTGGTNEERKNRDYLIDVMQGCGFSVHNSEWWHFAISDDDYTTLNITFAEFMKNRDEYKQKKQY